MFLVVGIVTICVGILVLFFLPDNPMKSRLSHEEKVWAVERLRVNQTGIENEHVSSLTQSMQSEKTKNAYLVVFFHSSSQVRHWSASPTLKPT